MACFFDDVDPIQDGLGLIAFFYPALMNQSRGSILLGLISIYVNCIGSLNVTILVCVGSICGINCYNFRYDPNLCFVQTVSHIPLILEEDRTLNPSSFIISVEN